MKGSLKAFRKHFSKLKLDPQGLLVFEISSENSVPLIPESDLARLATELHELLSHVGRDKTIVVMNEKFYHPKFPSIIAEVVRSCIPCQCHKGGIPKKYPVYKRQVSTPYELFAVDLMDLPRSRKGNKCILVGIDLFSKYGYAIPLKSKKSAVVARALESRVLAATPRTPKTILSDNGPEFRGGPFHDLLQRYGIAHDNSVPYVPSTNGAVERLNQTLRSRLATVCHNDTRNWDKKLFEVIAQYNRSPHSETQKAPADFFVPRQ